MKKMHFLYLYISIHIILLSQQFLYLFPFHLFFVFPNKNFAQIDLIVLFRVATRNNACLECRNDISPGAKEWCRMNGSNGRWCSSLVIFQNWQADSVFGFEAIMIIGLCLVVFKDTHGSHNFQILQTNSRNRHQQVTVSNQQASLLISHLSYNLWP